MVHRTSQRAVFVVLALTASSILNGCAHTTVVSSFQQTASVHVVPIAVSRWEDYVSTLQPQYPMTPATALALALPRTSISQSSVADIFSAGLQLGLPQSTQSSSLTQALTNGATGSFGSTNNAGTTNNATANGTTTNSGTATSNSTATNSSTTTSSVTANNGVTTTQTTTTQQTPGTLPPNMLPAATLPNATTLTSPTGAIAVDPLLTYQAATAVYQEVQLLNNYLKDAALRYGYVPYLARLQVSIVPFAHKQPYDAYVDISAFAKCRDSDDGLPIVTIPLLVTDDVETGQAASASNVARQLAFSLGGVAGNAALQAGLSDLKDEFKSILGTDFNSLYMVTRASDNTLQIRFGAARHPDPKVAYSMLTQTHNVTFLMLVDGKYSADSDRCFKPLPDEAEQYLGPRVWINSYTRFRSAVTGEELPVDRQAIRDHAIKVVERLLPPGATVGAPIDYAIDIAPLLDGLQTNDMGSFREALQHLWCKYHLVPCEHTPGLRLPAENLWSTLTSVLNMSEFTGTVFNLPQKQRPTAVTAALVYLHDNCKDATTANVAGISNVIAGRFVATLTLAGSAPITFAATSMAQAPNGSLTIQFPSLQPFAGVATLTDAAAIAPACPSAGGTPAPPKSLHAEISLREVVDERWRGNEHAAPEVATFPTVYYDGAAQARSVSVSIVPASDTIQAVPNQTGVASGQLRLLVSAGKDLADVVITFNGATIVNPLSPALPYVSVLEKTPQPGASLKVLPPPGDGTGKFGSAPIVVDVTLQGFVASRSMTVTATGRDAQGNLEGVATVAIPVVAAAPAK